MTASDVTVIGAGPAGLMLAANLVRFGIKTVVLDDRPDKTSTGRADGLQPKSIETLRQMRLCHPLLMRGVRIYDICFWSSAVGVPLRRTGREAHFPAIVDVLDPYILLVHQGMVEELFLDDMRERNVEVTRNTSFLNYEQTGDTIAVTAKTNGLGEQHIFRTRYLVGCDGAHSQVRKCLPGAQFDGSSSEAVWAVLDGVIKTDFPDIWSKVVIYSEVAGNILCIPRERNMTRLYIELKPETGSTTSRSQASQDFVIERARQIIAPYSLEWERVEWFGIYRIGQRVAKQFANETQHVFIAGDASHTHSPKAAQGMNTSMHDSLNLAWKLNLAIRGLARPSLLMTYQRERQKIAHDLINFDYEHANAFHAGDAKALSQNFLTNIRFISGFGVEYEASILNQQSSGLFGLRPGCLLVPAKGTRYIDANPVDLQLDIPMLGQFRIYFVVRKISRALKFLRAVCDHISSSTSVLGRVTTAAEASYQIQSAAPTAYDDYVQPTRYTAVSKIFTLALITDTPKSHFELADLPPLLQASRWTVYLDNVANLDTTGTACIEKWWSKSFDASELGIVNVRPDGYVGAMAKWPLNDPDAASSWLDAYFGAFLCA